jgi:hypothetical protein
MRKIKGFLSLILGRHRYTITQTFLDTTEVTRLSCRHVPANDQAA